MHPVLQLLYSLPLVVYYIVEGIILAFIPKRLRYKDITGQTVLITGAGSGIGRELAIEFSRLDARLVLLDLNAKGLEETRSLLDRWSNDVYLHRCDVSDREAVYATAEKIKDQVGFVDILVNNAGFVTGKKFMECPDDKIRKTFEVNILAHFWMCKAFLPQMKSSARGHLVFVSSLAGLAGFPQLSDYGATKHAVLGFEESLRIELEAEGLRGVKSTVVCPHLVSTGFFDGFDVPLVKRLTPEYVAREIVSGVLVEQEILILPSYLQFIFILKAIIPRNASRAFYKGVGIIPHAKETSHHNGYIKGKELINHVLHTKAIQDNLRQDQMLHMPSEERNIYKHSSPNTGNRTQTPMVGKQKTNQPSHQNICPTIRPDNI